METFQFIKRDIKQKWKGFKFLSFLRKQNNNNKEERKFHNMILRKDLKSRWGKKIPYSVLLEITLTLFTITILQWQRKKKRKKWLSSRLVYLSILLIQLYNGLRVGEATKLFKRWLLNGNQTLTIERRNLKENLKIEIPDIVRKNKEELRKAGEMIFGVKLRNLKSEKVKIWSKRTLGINTTTFQMTGIEYREKKY